MKRIDGNAIINKLNKPVEKEIRKTLNLKVMDQDYIVKVYKGIDIESPTTIKEMNGLLEDWFQVYLKGVAELQGADMSPFDIIETEDLMTLIVLYMIYGTYTDLVLPSVEHSLVDLVLFMGTLATEGVQEEILESIGEGELFAIRKMTYDMTGKWASYLSDTLEAESLKERE